jgi:hypothetical protein
MIITLTKREAREIAKAFNTMEKDGAKELKEATKGNKVITYNVTLNGSVEIQIAPDYLEEFLKTSGKYLALFVPQVQALHKTVCMFQEEIQAVGRNYTKGEK